jgi:dUTPase
MPSATERISEDIFLIRNQNSTYMSLLKVQDRNYLNDVLLLLQKPHKKVILRYTKLDPEAIPLARHFKDPEAADICTPFAQYLTPNRPVVISTRLSLWIPRGYLGQTIPAYNLSLRHGVLMEPLTLNSNFHGEVKITVMNVTNKPIQLRRGGRIARILCKKVKSLEIREVRHLELDA